MNAGPLIPPRPIPEPLDWPEPAVWPWWPWFASLVGLAVLIGVATLVRRQQRPSGGASNVPDRRPPSTPTEVLIDRAERVREALVARFGPSWAARTTEEVAGSPEIKTVLRDEDVDVLVGLLQAADRAKFAVVGIDEDELAPYSEVWLTALLMVLAGATTSRNGKWSEPT
jgi:hypothetical protein